MFSNWLGLNIVSYGNWIVSPLMEMCQTCSYTQQTADSEWRSMSAGARDREGRGKRKFFLIICLASEKKMSRWERVAGSCCSAAIELLGIIPSLSSNIYLMINPLLAPGLSKSCWLCSQSNPPGYLVRSVCRQSRDRSYSFPVGVIFSKRSFHVNPYLRLWFGPCTTVQCNAITGKQSQKIWPDPI